MSIHSVTTSAGIDPIYYGKPLDVWVQLLYACGITTNKWTHIPFSKQSIVYSMLSTIVTRFFAIWPAPTNVLAENIHDYLLERCNVHTRFTTRDKRSTIRWYPYINQSYDSLTEEQKQYMLYIIIILINNLLKYTPM